MFIAYIIDYWSLEIGAFSRLKNIRRGVLL